MKRSHFEKRARHAIAGAPPVVPPLVADFFSMRKGLGMTMLLHSVLLQARAGARSVIADVACPVCGPTKSTHGAKRKVMRTWLITSGIITYRCARCGVRGYCFPDRERPIETPSSEERAAAEADKAKERSRKIALADCIWREASPIAGTAGASYLAARGIDLDQVPGRGGLRWHSRCPWGACDYVPCIVARFTDVMTGEPCGIHRRPVDGQKPRTLGPMKNCIVRLWPDDMVIKGLVLAEGIETALAAATRITHRGTLLQPAWAAGNAGNIETFPVLGGIEALTLLVDHDASGSGQYAAADCARRWLAAEREVIRLTPKTIGDDFNDIVKKRGVA
jgi:hypothetical protein